MRDLNTNYFTLLCRGQYDGVLCNASTIKSRVYNYNQVSVSMIQYYGQTLFEMSDWTFTYCHDRRSSLVVTKSNVFATTKSSKAGTAQGRCAQSTINHYQFWQRYRIKSRQKPSEPQRREVQDHAMISRSVQHRTKQQGSLHKDQGLCTTLSLVQGMKVPNTLSRGTSTNAQDVPKTEPSNNK